MLVKTWSLNTAPPAPATCDDVPDVLFSDSARPARHRCSRVIDPVSVFANHFLVLYKGRYMIPHTEASPLVEQAI